MEGRGGRDKAGRGAGADGKPLLRERLAEMCDVLAHRGFKRLAARVGCTVAPLAMVACGGDAGDDSPSLTPVEEWTARAEYGFGDRFEGDAVFGFYLDVRVPADGSRVYVLDAEASEATIRTPDGSLIRRVGRRGEGPGEFSNPGRLVFFDDGFYIKDDRRITRFTMDGELAGTDAFPVGVNYHNAGVQYWAMFSDRSFMALSAIDLMDESLNFYRADHVALLRVLPDGGSWRSETLATLSFEDYFSSVPVDGDTYPLPQRWLAPDHFQPDPGNSSLVVSRTQTELPGVVDFVELSTEGDTLWTRRIRLPPIPLREDSIAAAVEEVAAIIAQSTGNGTPSPQLKRRIRDSWIIPEYWPALRQIHLMSNGEIWFRPPGNDDRRIWYAVRKGEEEGAIRRVFAPEWFVPSDVNDTHVWGIRRDELDVAYVAGLRLERGVGR